MREALDELLLRKTTSTGTTVIVAAASWVFHHWTASEGRLDLDALLDEAFSALTSAAV